MKLHKAIPTHFFSSRAGLIVLSTAICLVPILFHSVYGHGVGGETLPPVMIGNRNVTLSIAETQASTDPKNTNKAISIQLYETNTKNPVKEVTFFVEASKDNNVLFSHAFKRDQGGLAMTIVTTYSGEVRFEEQKGWLDSLFTGNSGEVDVIGPIFGSGGLYKFHIEILTVDSYNNKLQPAVKYDPAISIPDTTTYKIHDKNYGEQNIGIITYYDQISNFQYVDETKSINFFMPFDWSEDNIKQVSVVHEEIKIPKSFGSLLVTKYNVLVNDLPIPDRAITIDDYSGDDRIIHIVLNKPELQDLAKINENVKHGMQFRMLPSKETAFPMTFFTKNGQYKVDLSWEPSTIMSGSKVSFLFDFKDGSLVTNKTLGLTYDFSIDQNDKVIFKQQGQSSESNYAGNVIDVSIPVDLSGPVRIKFDNLGANPYASAEFVTVVNREIITPPQFPIKLVSQAKQGDSKVSGKYEIELTWFPSIIPIDQQTEFVFTIKSKDGAIPVSHSTYDFVILQKNNEVYRKTGVAAAGGDFVDYSFSNGQDGPAVLKIENINGSGESIEMPILVTPEFPTGLLPILFVSLVAMLVLVRLKMGVRFSLLSHHV